jgi:4-alpha-glucanotransferase
MIIHFFVAFRSEFNQTIALNIQPLTHNNNTEAIKIPLHYLNESYWHATIKTSDFQIDDAFEYSYIFNDYNTGSQKEICKKNIINTKKLTSKKLDIVDDWQEEDAFADVFQSKPFATVFNQVKEKLKVADIKKPTHIFKVKAPALGMGKIVCITGASKKLKEWDSAKPLLMEAKKNHWTLKLNLAKETFPIEYKLGIYDVNTHTMEYEDGDNRVLYAATEKDTLTLLHQKVDTRKYQWRATGINVPVSALKSSKSWGVGEFTDLNLLTDIARKTGIKLIQLLPINDTTSTHTNKDSYPYSAVSAFALHPIYLNVQKLAHALSVAVPTPILEKIAALNEADSLHYEEVLAIKNEVIKSLYQKDKIAFKDDLDWFAFFDLNRHWLVPYAAYCYLRDKNKTADYNTWGPHEFFDEDAVQALVSPENDFYDEVALHYFTQYHLHLQLKDAVDYAHKSGIILKGDLPIGVGRFGADAWMYRSLFHMDMQAGAPPDAFATKGQNWSFPTYNWEKMAEDNYAWWRQRMEHMSNYFDAIRIDHVLGFFRIWSIPMHSIEGILGKFVPAWPLNVADFTNQGIQFSDERFCDPYITEELLQNWFGANTGIVKDLFLNNYRFKDNLDSQRKIAAYFVEDPQHAHLQQGLFDLLTNVIAIRDDEHPQHYHIRISMQSTDSYKHLPFTEQQGLNRLFDEYFFNKQNALWEKEGIKKLQALKSSTDMLICAEDLGMVPQMVEAVLANMQMLALEVQRMPKKINELFSNPAHSPYLSVVTPSTHDMATIREWWEEDRKTIRQFYNQQLGHSGEAPYYAEPWVCKDVIIQHLHSPAMWAVFLLQDLLAVDGTLRIENPKKERINNPANPDHYWNYRMHINLEQLQEHRPFLDSLKTMIEESGR